MFQKWFRKLLRRLRRGGRGHGINGSAITEMAG
jgi:hypothetical protein